MAAIIAAADFQPRAQQDDLAATHWLQTKEAIAAAPAVVAQAVDWWRGTPFAEASTQPRAGWRVPPRQDAPFLHTAHYLDDA